MSTINGTDGNDSLEGTSGDDSILGGDGNDTLYGDWSQFLAGARLQGASGAFFDQTPQVTPLEGGGYAVTWAGATSDGQGFDIFVQRFNADGSLAGAADRFQGMAGNLGDFEPQIVARPGGGYVVTWRGATSDGQGNDIFVQSVDADGSLSGLVSRLQGMAGNLGDDMPQITALPGGGHVVTWRGATSDGQGNDIFVQRFNPDGTQAGGTSRLQGMSGNLGDTRPQITALPDGGHVVTWRGVTSDGQSSDIFVQRFNPDGTQAGGPARLQGVAGNLFDTDPEIVALADGGYVVTWQGDSSDGQGTEIFVQRFTADGSLAGGPARLQGMPGALADTTPQITALAGGGYAVSWRGETSDGQGADVFVQQFNPDGSLAGATTRLQGMAGNLSASSPKITALPDGGYAVVWDEATSDGQGSDIFVQRFSADGSLSGDADRLRGLSGNLTDMTPEIAALEDGSLVVTWTAFTSDGQETDIFVQRLYAPTGGDDTILGGAGDDLIFGGGGDDFLRATTATTRSSAAMATIRSWAARATTCLPAAPAATPFRAARATTRSAATPTAGRRSRWPRATESRAPSP
jgi:hypothetical protein